MGGKEEGRRKKALNRSILLRIKPQSHKAQPIGHLSVCLSVPLSVCPLAAQLPPSLAMAPEPLPLAPSGLRAFACAVPPLGMLSLQMLPGSLPGLLQIFTSLTVRPSLSLPRPPTSLPLRSSWTRAFMFCSVLYPQCVARGSACASCSRNTH